MPRLRPPRDGIIVNNIIAFAAALLLLPWLVETKQQQGAASVLQRQESPHEALEAQRLDVTKVAHNLETPYAAERRKNTLSFRADNIKIKNDASAIATLAPAKQSAVAAPSSRQPSRAGLASPHVARNLEDWEVEDFVLLATVDGKLHARDRKTGRERWSLELEKPMVETIDHRPNLSNVNKDYQPISMHDYVWIVEPSQNGNLYIYRQGPMGGSLMNTGLTMKSLVDELSPYGDEDPYVTYTGKKETSMVTIDAKTGAVVKFFGTGGNPVNPGNCLNSNAFLDQGKCSPNSTLTIGRTEYTVAIQERNNGDQIATITFSEWSPNNFDLDLQSQYKSTLDNQYIYSSHDGTVVGLDHGSNSPNPVDEPLRRFNHKLSSPVARVFDVARPWGTEKETPELVVLPQPKPPHEDDDHKWENSPSSRIFLNHTEDGSWYAMSGRVYPYAVQGAGQARINHPEWIQRNPFWDSSSNFDWHEDLVGVHSIEIARRDKRLTIGPGEQEREVVHQNSTIDKTPAAYEGQVFVQQFQSLAAYFIDFITNPMILFVVLGFMFMNQQKLRAWIGRLGHHKEIESAIESTLPKDSPKSILRPSKNDRDLEIPDVSSEVTTPPPNSEGVTDDLDAGNEEGKPMSQSTAVEHPISGRKVEDVGDVQATPVPEKRKTHRGKRGGVKHKKGPKPVNTEQSSDGSTPKPAPTVEDAVKKAQNMGQQTKLEPDIKTIPSDPTEVSGPIIRVGALEVNTDKRIGSGSNGTLVFEGNFDGRQVAVKRMLIQFFDIASQETKLLRESDDHPNVIRYYAQQQAAEFLYIALELCPASLADVIEKPQNHRDLAHAGEQDLPNVLYQITNGLQHLHNLRIVHRDLKPQNILVSMGKDGRPRLLVSDFGLCKKLDGEQSSFRATTAHAAGTSGWRAPELLLDDDAKEGSTMVDASTDGNSGPLVNPELMPNRRATRAIDIFSLGLVFFYVLSKGSHPFDCGDRYMREVNIRKGIFDLKLLGALGDYAYEANDLIHSMLQPEPKARPQAHHVMAHPFFWSAKKRLNFLCDVSDHFEKEKRDPPTAALQELERWAPSVCRSDFLRPLGKEFVESMGKQRKYTGTKLLDLLRALRNKKNHYEDMSDHLKEHVGPLPDGYLHFWTRKFPNLLITCWNIVYEVQWDDTDRFKEYYQPAGL